MKTYLLRAVFGQMAEKTTWAFFLVPFLFCTHLSNANAFVPITNLSISNETATSFEASWDFDVNHFVYQIEVYKGLQDANPSPSDVLPNYNNIFIFENTITVTDLDLGATYTIFVRGADNAGTSFQPSSANATTLFPSPTGLTASNIGFTYFDLNWDAQQDIDGVDGIELEISSSSSFTNPEVQQNFSPFQSAHFVNNLQEGTLYYVRLRNQTSSSEGLTYSSYTILEVTTQTDGPLAPTVTASNQTSDGFLLSWDDQGGGFTYLLDIRKGDEFEFGEQVTAYTDVVVTNTSIAVTGLEPAVQYSIRLQAQNNGEISNPSFLTTNTLLPVPTGFRIETQTLNEFSLNWDDLIGTTVARIQVSTDPNFSTFFLNEALQFIQRPFLVNGIDANQTYYCRIQGVGISNVGFDLSDSEFASLTVAPLTIPNPPTATAATFIETTSFQANWEAAANVTSYTVEVSETVNFDIIEQRIENITDNHTTISSTLPNTTVFYRVSANRGGLISDFSNIIEVTTLPLFPQRPEALDATNITQTSFQANWRGANHTSYIESHFLLTVTDLTDNLPILESEVVTGTSYQVTNLSPDHDYRYYLQAVNASGTSGTSNTERVQTLPPLPEVPVAVDASDIEKNSFRANWLSTLRADYYQLHVINEGTGVVIVANETVNDLTDYVGQLEAGTSYLYKVRAINAAGESEYSNDIQVTTLPEAPDEPVLLPATEITQTSFRANWESAARASHYFLSVYDETNQTTVVDDQRVEGSTSFVVTGLEENTRYHYYVQAVNVSGSDYSRNNIQATTLPPTPTAREASNITTNSFQANWFGIGGINRYVVEVSETSDFSNILPAYNQIEINNDHLIITDIQGSQTYYYRIRTKNDTGLSPTSNIITVLPAAIPPQNVQLTLGGYPEMTLTWEESANALSYEIEVATDADFNSLIASLETASTSQVISNLQGNTTYFARVRAVTTSNKSAYSNTSLRTPYAPPIPLTTGAYSHNSFRVDYTQVPEVDRYQLEYAIEPTFSSILGNPTVPGAISSFHINLLASNQRYYYRVRSGTESTNTWYSDVKEVTTRLPFPQLSFTGIGFEELILTWNSVPDAVTYDLEVATDQAYTNVIFREDNITSLTKQISNLAPNTTYYCKIRAVSSTNASVYISSTISTLTPAVALPATQITTSSFQANWTDVPDATYYSIQLANNPAFSPVIVSYKPFQEDGNQLAFTDLDAGQTYYYRLTTHQDGFVSALSETIEVTTILAAPQNIALSLGNYPEMTLSWEASASNSSGYEIDVSTDGDFNPIVAQYSPSATATSQLIGNLEGNTSYFVRVRSIGNGASSDYATTSIQTPYAPPVIVGAINIESSSYTADFNPISGVGLYTLEHSEYPDFSTFSSLNTGSANDIPVTGLSANRTYYYRIKTGNPIANTWYSPVQEVQTKLETPIGREVSNITDQGFIAKWNTVPHATVYEVEVSTTSDYSDIVAHYDQITALEQTVTELTANQTYYYRVRAKNTTNSSAYLSRTIRTYQTYEALPATMIDETSFQANWIALPGPDGALRRHSLIVREKETGTQVAKQNKHEAGNYAFVVRNLNPNTMYEYYIEYTEIFSTKKSNTIDVRTLEPTFDAPIALAAAPIHPTSFTANWEAVSGATGYQLEVSKLASFSSIDQRFLDIPVNTTSFDIVNLISNVTYYYRVRATLGTYATANSNTITVKTTLPAPVMQEVFAITENSFTASWSRVVGTTSYILEMADDEAFTTNFRSFIPANANDPVNFIISGLEADHTYYLRVKVNENSPYSNIVTATTSLPRPIASRATAITSSSFQANWSGVEGVTDYALEVATDNEFTNILPNYNQVTVTGNSLAVTGVNYTENYFYRVRAIRNGTAGIPSNVVQVVLPLLPPPTLLAPSSISATAFTINWESVAGAENYVLEIATTNAFNNAEQFIIPAFNPDPVTSFEVTNRDPNTRYYYRMKSGVGNELAYSLAPSLVTRVASPVALLPLVVTRNTIIARWEAVPGADRYSIRAVGLGIGIPPDIRNLSINAPATSVNISGLDSDRDYRYEVTAYVSNPNNGSLPSNTVTVRTLAGTPTILDPNDVTATSFQAVWRDGSAFQRLEISTDPTFTSQVDVYEFRVNTNRQFDVEDLTSNQTYYYRMKSNLSPYEEYSEVAEVTTLLPTPVALDPTDIRETSFVARWEAVAEATSYEVRIIGGTLTTVTVPATELQLLVENLNANTGYSYDVKAVTTTNESETSNIVRAQTLAPAPVLLEVSNVTSARFTIKWIPVTGVSEYVIQVATDESFSSPEEFIVNGSARSYVVRNRLHYQKYYYRIKSNTDENALYSDAKEVLTLFPRPVAFAPKSYTDVSFVAQWRPMDRVEFYQLEVSSTPDFATILASFDRLPSTQTEQEITGVMPYSLYYYRVRVSNGTTISEYSNTRFVRTLASPPVLAAATGISESRFQINWTPDPAAPLIYAYRIEVATDPDFSTVEVVNASKLRRIQTISNRLPDQAYYYRIQLKSGDNLSSYSEVGTVRTEPVSVKNLSLISQNNAFTAVWSRVIGAANYTVEVATDAAFMNILPDYNGLVITNSRIKVAGLETGTEYFFRVKVLRTDGVESEYATASTYTLPANFSVQVDQETTGATLSWPTLRSVTHYVVDISTSPDFSVPTQGYDQTQTTETSITLTGLAPLTLHYFRVRAVNPSGSKLVTGGAITNEPFTVVGTDDGFQVNWNQYTNINEYQVWVKRLGSNRVINRTNAISGLTHTVTGLRKGTYFLELRAHTIGAPLIYGQEVKTLPAPPTNIIVNEVNTRNMTFSIGGSRSLVDEYLVSIYNATNPSEILYDEVPTTASSFTASGMQADTRYVVEVKSANDFGISTSSTRLEVKSPPLSPTNLSASSPKENQLALQWAMPDNAVYSYVDIATDPDFLNLIVRNSRVIRQDAAIQQKTYSGLTGNTNYYYRIRVTERFERQPFASSDYAHSSATTIPGRIQGVEVSDILSDGFTVTWLAQGTEAITYEVSIIENRGDTTVYDPISASSFTVDGLKANQVYFVLVKGSNAVGTSQTVQRIRTLTVPAIPEPSVIPEDMIEATRTFVYWGNTLRGKAQEVEVNVATTSSALGSLIGIDGLGQIIFTDTVLQGKRGIWVENLQPNTTYYYKLRAFNASGASGYSRTAEFTTKLMSFEIAEARNTATDMVTVGDSQYDYFLEVATDRDFNNRLVGFESVPINLGDVTISELPQNTILYFRVRFERDQSTDDQVYDGIINGFSQVERRRMGTTLNEPLNVTENSFTATWAAGQNNLNYFFTLRDAQTDEVIQPYALLPVDGTTLEVNGVSLPNTSYYYEVQTATSSTPIGNLVGNSNRVLIGEPSDELTLTLLSGDNTSLRFELRGNQLHQYTLELANDTEFANIIRTDENPNIEQGILTVDNLTPNTIYYVRVKTSDADGEGDGGGELSRLLFPFPPPVVYTYSNIVTTLTGTTIIPSTNQSITSFTANWLTSEGAYPIDYFFTVRHSADNTVVPGYDDLAVTGNSFDVTGLSPGVPYYYQIRSRVFVGPTEEVIGFSNTRSVINSTRIASAQAEESSSDSSVTNWSIYPTLLSNTLHVSLPQEGAVNNMYLYDMNGKLYQIQRTIQSTSHQLELDVSHLPSGVYIFKIVTADRQVISQKLVKQ